MLILKTTQMFQLVMMRMTGDQGIKIIPQDMFAAQGISQVEEKLDEKTIQEIKEMNPQEKDLENVS